MWFSHISRYSCQHSHFCALHDSLRYRFHAHRTLPYQAHLSMCLRGFGDQLEPRYIFRARPLDQ